MFGPKNYYSSILVLIGPTLVLIFLLIMQIIMTLFRKNTLNNYQK